MKSKKLREYEKAIEELLMAVACTFNYLNELKNDDLYDVDETVLINLEDALEFVGNFKRGWGMDLHENCDGAPDGGHSEECKAMGADNDN